MSQLVDQANHFIFNCLAPSTRLTYQAAFNSYSNCFAAHGEEAPFPATQVSLVLWLTHSATRSNRALAPSTLRTYLSSLSSLHEELGFRNLLEDKPLVNRCWKGIKRFAGASKMIRRPITTDILARMKSLLNDSFASVAFFAAASLATYGLLRMGEFTTHTTSAKNSNPFKLLTLQQLKLMKEDGSEISILSPLLFHQVTNMSILLRTSKTDPFRKTVTVRIGHAVPVQAMLTYLRVHPVLVQAQPNLNAPLFVSSLSSLQPLTRDIVIKVTRHLLSGLGLDEKEFFGHSFRKGGATSLSKAGVAESVIQLVGRWTSDCYKLYIVTPIETLLDASRAM